MKTEADIQKRALEQAFGELSDDDDVIISSSYSSSVEEEGKKGANWEAVEGINGLWVCREFLSETHQSSLLSAIQREGWFAESCHNQAMRFGDLPGWATELSRLVREAVCFGDLSFKEGQDLISQDPCTEEESCPLPFDLLWREPLFDQLIVNAYKPGEGICAHVDLMRFEDGIAIISMESPCIMHFSRANSEVQEGTERSSTKIAVFLNPGSLILMSGEARYLWKHEINRKPGFQTWEGKEIHQQRRTSVTLRKLCPSPNCT